MIQRIQSIFLLLAAGAGLGLLGLPFASTAQAQEGSALFADAQFLLNDNMVLLGLFVGGGALFLITIFLFRNRRLQMTLSLFGILLMVAGAAWGGYLFSQNIPDQAYDIKAGTALPLLGIIFAMLAYNRIKKDDKLVRSMDRLR